MNEETKQKILELARECPLNIPEIVDKFFKEQTSHNLKILQNQIDRCVPPKSNHPAIHYAISHGNLQLLKLYFLITNLNINTKSEYYGTAFFHIAIKLNKKAIVNFLIESGIDVNRKNHENITPLQNALSRGRTEIALTLFNKIYKVSLSDPMELIKFLLDKSENYVTYYIPESEEFKTFSTLLFYALTLHKDAFRMVLSVSPIEYLYETHPYFETTILSFIVRRGKKAMLKIAIEFGVNLNYSENCCEKPLYDAIIECPKMIPCLVKNGAEILSKNDDIFHGSNIDIFRELGEYEFSKAINTIRKLGLDIYKNIYKNNENELHQLCRFADEDNCKSFLMSIERGTDVNHLNNDNYCLLKFALEDDLYVRKDKGPIILILVSIIVKMMKNKDFVNSANIECLSDWKIRIFTKNCENEIIHLKERKIIDKFSIVYYDFLTSNLKKLTALARNKEIIKKFRFENYEEEFLIYAQHLKRGYERSIWRLRKLEQIYRNFSSVKFPLLAFEQICGYLNDHELTMSKYYFKLLEKFLSDGKKFI